MTACTSVDGRQAASLRTVPNSSPMQIRQTDAQGRKLPFTTKFRHRWNSANSGTTYEPCTAAGSADVDRLGVDLTTVKDIAGTDGQTSRGCTWKYSGVDRDHGWSVTQVVGNSPSLATDKQKRRSVSDQWRSDVTIDGRLVGLHTTTYGRACDTYVQSGQAAVSTFVSVIDRGIGTDEVCERALAFTRATIGQMPP
nr:DUF3558 family protein [Gordonia sp. PP30]